MITLNELIKDKCEITRYQSNIGVDFIFSLYNWLVINKYHKTFDFDVYLSTKGFNLQRPYVWTENQQKELIWSMLLGRYIPPFTFIVKDYDTYLVIDGKQRLLTIKRYMENKFPIDYEGQKIYWNDLDVDSQNKIAYPRNFKYNEYYEFEDELISDDEKIKIFNFYNFAGTPQEEQRREKLLKALNKP